MSIHYSPSTNSFYHEFLKERYELTGSWPKDTRPVSDIIHREFTKNPPSDHELGPDKQGMPSWVRKQTNPDQIIKTTRERINSLREEALSDEKAFVKTSDGVLWQVDKRSTDLLMQAITLYSALGETPEGFIWRDANNVNREADLPLLLSIASARAEQVKQAYDKSWALKDQLDSLNLNSPTILTDLENIFNS